VEILQTYVFLIVKLHIAWTMPLLRLWSRCFKWQLVHDNDFIEFFMLG